MAKTPKGAAGKPSESPSEYDRFEKLTKDLLTVDKKDLDEARAKDEAERRP